MYSTSFGSHRHKRGTTMTGAHNHACASLARSSTSTHRDLPFSARRGAGRGAGRGQALNEIPINVLAARHPHHVHRDGHLLACLQARNAARYSVIGNSKAPQKHIGNSCIGGSCTTYMHLTHDNLCSPGGASTQSHITHSHNRKGHTVNT
jgi:hypothetical protein